MRILIAGASGFVGTALVPFLQTRGYTVHRLERHGRGELSWDPENGKINLPALEDYDAVINLAGSPIFGRWNASVKQKIFNSRIESTRLLVNSFLKLKNPPKTFINASAIGFYGSRGDAILTENSSPGTGFLADVCQAWENEAEKAMAAGCRVVTPRLGIVLAPNGGALKQMLTPFKMGFGGKIGSGAQWMSWIALEDLLEVFFFCLTTPSLQGAVNAVAPGPVTNAEFTKELGKVLHRPTFLPLPAFVARLALGREMADETLLASTKVDPEKLKEISFKFAYPTLESYFKHVRI